MFLTEKQQSDIKNIYHKYLRGSEVAIFNHSILGSEDTYIKFLVSGNDKERYNTYIENDMLHLCLTFYTNGKTFGVKANSNCYFIKPIYHPYNAYDHKTILFRTIKGLTWEETKKRLDKFFKRLADNLRLDLEANIISDRNEKDYYGNNVSHKYILSKHLAI